jgi:HK97 family phage portal protein
VKKAPLRRRVGLKFLAWSQSLLGGSQRWRGGNEDTAPPYTGPESVAALAAIPTVYRAVTVKANDKARVPLLIGRRKNGTFKPMDPTRDEPAKLFDTVNPVEGPAAFWARAYQLEQLTGDMFVQLERLKTNRVKELWLLQSDRMTVLKGPARRPRGYEYAQGDGSILKLAPEDVFHTRLPSGGDAWLQEAVAKLHVRNVRQGGVPPGWLKIPNSSPEERIELRDEIRKRLSSPDEAYRIGILWDDAEFIRGGVSARDGEFLGLSDETKEYICSVFGVPPVYVMNLKQAKYDNMLQQKEMYWYSTLIPELVQTAQDLTAWLRLEYGDESLEAVHDLERVEAIQDLRLVRAEALQRQVAGGLMTQNEARALLGLPKATGGDALYFPQALQPTGTVVVPQPALALPAFGRKAWLDDPARHAKRDESKRDMGSFVPELERRVVDLERRIEAQVRAALLKAHGARGKADAGDVDWDAVLAEYETTLGSAYAKIVSTRGQAALDGVVDDGIFDLTVPGVTDWLSTVGGEQSKLIVATLKDQLAEALAAGDTAEETATTIATRIAELFELRRNEANRIAWTETGKAYNFGTLEGFRQSEVVTKKEWLSVDDEHTRDAHREADGQVVGLDEFFLVDGELLDFPGAPGASAGNAINCRCAMQPVIDEDAKAARSTRLRNRVVLEVDLEALFAEPATRNGIAH